MCFRPSNEDLYGVSGIILLTLVNVVERGLSDFEVDDLTRQVCQLVADYSRNSDDSIHHVSFEFQREKNRLVPRTRQPFQPNRCDRLDDNFIDHDRVGGGHLFGEGVRG